MVNYKCPRCGYENNIKTKYINHLRRKKLCNPELSDNNLQHEYIKYKISDKINNTAQITQKTTKKIKTPAEFTQKTAKIRKLAKCKFCKKEFTRKDSLSRHLKTCKEKIKDDEEKKIC